MKKFLLATIVLVTLTTAAFAGNNDVLFKSLSSAFKSSTHIVWSKAGDYKLGTFDFNGKTANVFYDADNDNLIGYSVHVGLDELPAGTAENIQKRFNGWAITDRILFTDTDGNTGYYVQVTKGKHNIALSVSSKGKAHLFSQMP